MKPIITLCVVSVLLSAVPAFGDRCIGPMDTSSLVTTTYGIQPFTTDDIVWCDDFGTYCSENYDNTVYWPGYPPNPDTTLCTNGPGTYGEWWMKTANTIDGHNWDKNWSGNNFGVTDARSLRFEGWNGNSGWITLPFVAAQAGNQSPLSGRAYYEFAMTEAIEHKYTGSTAVNGTDGNPLVLRYWLHDNVGLSESQQSAWGFPANWQFYLELFLDNDRAPVDYVMAADTNAQCVAEGINWPVICQQNPRGQGVLPPNCPDTATYPRPVHASLAFGWLAALDLNPCDVDTGRKPTMYHAATFDGQQWSRLIANQNPGNGGDFNYGMSSGFFEMTIKSSTYDVRLIAPFDCRNDGCPNPPGYTIGTSTAINLPRLYTGPFNKVGMGGGLGCELDSANGWVCKSESVRNSRPWTWTSNPAYVDRPVLLGGVGNITTGACCMNDGSCDDLDGTACQNAGGRFAGANTTCATTVCCPLPFADADTDGDVDQDDFGAFQMCYNGSGAVPTGCECYDRNVDGKVDATDFQSFNYCWTGPNVPWSTDIAPNCEP